jgi:hypothetical protein
VHKYFILINNGTSYNVLSYTRLFMRREVVGGKWVGKLDTPPFAVYNVSTC